MLRVCRRMFQSSDDLMRKLLQDADTIAVVGLSTEPSKPSYEVSHVLQHEFHKRIVPIRPIPAGGPTTVLDETIFESLEAAEDSMDVSRTLINIFRKPQDVPSVVDSVLKLRVKPLGIWCQLGITSVSGRMKAEAAGITWIEDRCLKIEARRLLPK